MRFSARGRRSGLDCRGGACHSGAVEAPYARIEEVEPGIGRLLAANPSPFTFTGTQSYFVGTRAMVVIDPGPDLPEHVDALGRAPEYQEEGEAEWLGSRRVSNQIRVCEAWRLPACSL